MADPTIEGLRQHLSFTEDMVGLDGALLARLVAAARQMIERRLGYTFAERYPGGQVPEALELAVYMLAAHWYENREATGADAREMPFGVADIVNDFRGWTF